MRRTLEMAKGALRRPAKVLSAIILLILASWLYEGSMPRQAFASQKKVTAKKAPRLLAAADPELERLATCSWADPPRLPLKRESDGELEATLRVAYARVPLTIGEETKQLWVRTYNGSLTGPTIEAKAGDTLKIHLRNDLPNQGSTCKDGDGDHGMDMGMSMKDGECAYPPKTEYNVTNLHTHGLHISPKGASDNVFKRICPGGGKFDYKFDILPAGNPGPGAAKHYPGTFWYHAHNHGSTAIQLASGMAGPLIIRGDIDEVPEIKVARERIFVLQQLAYDKDGVVEDFEKIKNEWKTGKRYTSINGRVKPVISLRPNQVERWRLIDAGIFEDLPIIIRPKGGQDGPAFKMYRIAIDGITRPAPEEVGPAASIKNVELGPGYRVDLLVQAPASPGIYELYKQKSELSLLGKGQGPEVNDPQVLAEIVVAGEPCTSSTPGCATRIPSKLPAPTDMLPDIQDEEVKGRERTVDFDVVDPVKQLFNINGSCFDHNKPIFEPTLGTAEQWEVTNLTDQVHPFHIHVNAFQMLDAQDKPAEWRDTIMVPPGGTVKFRTRFERFDGDFVLHCHILTHEDSGMMALVRVKPKAP